MAFDKRMIDVVDDRREELIRAVETCLELAFTSETHDTGHDSETATICVACADVGGHHPLCFVPAMQAWLLGDDGRG